MQTPRPSRAWSAHCRWARARYGRRAHDVTLRHRDRRGPCATRTRRRRSPPRRLRRRSRCPSWPGFRCGFLSRTIGLVDVQVDAEQDQRRKHPFPRLSVSPTRSTPNANGAAARSLGMLQYRSNALPPRAPNPGPFQCRAYHSRCEKRDNSRRLSGLSRHRVARRDSASSRYCGLQGERRVEVCDFVSRAGCAAASLLVLLGNAVVGIRRRRGRRTSRSRARRLHLSKEHRLRLGARLCQCFAAPLTSSQALNFTQQKTRRFQRVSQWS